MNAVQGGVELLFATKPTANPIGSKGVTAVNPIGANRDTGELAAGLTNKPAKRASGVASLCMHTARKTSKVVQCMLISRRFTRGHKTHAQSHPHRSSFHYFKVSPFCRMELR